jgi:hypothetical protein
VQVRSWHSWQHRGSGLAGPAGLSCLLLGCILAVGCSSRPAPGTGGARATSALRADDPAVGGAAVGGGCASDDDCATPLICLGNACHVECVTPRDCADGDGCVQGRGGLGVCASKGHPVGFACVFDVECAAPSVCAAGSCHTICRASADCPAGARCVHGDTSDAPDVCQLDADKACERDPDCAGAFQVCAAGECYDACVTSADCLSGSTCAVTAGHGTCH